MPIKILIADDHAVIRQGMVFLINDVVDSVKIFHAEDYTSLVAVLKKEYIDMVICDINMPGTNNFHLVEDIRRIQPGIKILIFSAYSAELYAARFLQAGADGYLNKLSSESEFCKAVKDILYEGTYVNKTIRARTSGNISVGNTGNPLQQLSDREMEVALLLLQGGGILEISNTLNLQMSTVSTYKKRVYEKIGISSLPELITVFRNFSGTVN